MSAKLTPADVARMRSLELRVAVYSIPEGEAAVEAQTALVQSILVGGALLAALRTHMDGLRALTYGRVRDMFSRSLKAFTLLDPRVGLAYLRGMTALRTVEITADDYASATWAVTAPCPAELTSLTLGVRTFATIQAFASLTQIRIIPTSELAGVFASSAQSLVRFDLSLGFGPTGYGRFDPSQFGLLAAMLQQHPRIADLTIRTAQPVNLELDGVTASALRAIRFVNVQASAETLVALGCKRVERIVTERSDAVGECPWPALVASAALPALGAVRVDAIDRDGVFDPLEVWPTLQRGELAQACQARRIGFSAFWDD